MLNGNRMKSGRGRSPRDFYKTPEALANNALWSFRFDEDLSSPPDCLDAGCGDGVWGIEAQDALTFAYDEHNEYPYVDGIDLRPQIPDYRKHLFGIIHKDDFLTHDFGNVRYDVIFGNPPYSLAEEFIKKAFTLTEDGGFIYFLLRLSFLEGIDRGKNFWNKYPLKTLYVCSRRPSFFQIDGKHTTDTLAYGMFLWKNGYEDDPAIKWLDWNYE